MGREANCVAQFDGQRSTGKLQLETDDLRFKGEFRLKILLKQIEKATAQAGTLTVKWPEGSARFELGDAAAKWADRINNPKSLLDKLGVKAGQVVSVIGIDDEEFLRDLRKHSPDFARETRKGSDLVFYRADTPADLKQVAKLKSSLKPDGALWIVSPKKRPEIVDTVVMAAGKAAGLVDVKVVRFSETYTALKFVIPKDKR
jgi:DUF3052 family protein